MYSLLPASGMDQAPCAVQSPKCAPQPDSQYLAVPPFHSPVYKSVKCFGSRFAFDARKIWNDHPNNVCNAMCYLIQEKAQNLPVSAKAYPQ